MKIIVSGSLGPISRPLAIKLVNEGHQVTVISSNKERQKEIENLGAKAAIGNIDDVDFLTETFLGADVAYLMEPTVSMFDPTIDILKHYEKICERYAQAVLHSGLKKIVHLSSIGGHSSTGNGMLVFHYYAEQALKKLPREIAITTLRPVSFYSNILAFIPTIKSHKAIITSYKAIEPEPWASPLDIAEAASEELVAISSAERKVRYIVSDEVTSDKLALVLGNAIGVEIRWITVPHETLVETYKTIGMSEQAANGFAGLNEAKNSGTLYYDLKKHKQEITFGNVKIEDFAMDFANAYENS